MCFIRDLNRLPQREGQKAPSFQSKATVLHAHCAFCQFLHRLCTTTMWNHDQILSSLENINGRVTNFIVSVWARTYRSSPFSSSFISQPLKTGQYYLELMRNSLKGTKFNFSEALSLALLLSDLKVPFVSCVNGTTTRGVYWVAIKFRFVTYM